MLHCTARNPEMTKLVKGHQDAQGQSERQYGLYYVHSALCVMGSGLQATGYVRQCAAVSVPARTDGLPHPWQK